MSGLLPALVLVPLVASALAAVLAPRRPRAAAVVGVATGVLVLLAVAAVVAGVAQHGLLRVEMAGWAPPLGIVLRADALSVVLLGLTAVVGLAVSVYATSGERVTGAPAYWSLWLALWAALNAVHLAGDLFTTYVALELMGLSAVSLVALGGPKALRPALRYLFVAVLGSLLLLLGIALVYAETGVLDMASAAAGSGPGPALTGVVAGAVLALVTVGMALKTALLPLHSWLPGAHSSAPPAVSPLLSALVVKASLVVLLRLWFQVLVVDDRVLAAAAVAVGVLASVAVVAGALLALGQSRLKLVVAYSTVAQVGYLFLVFPLASPGLDAAAGSDLVAAAAAGWTGALVLVVAHGVAKAAMFLAAGNLAMGYGSDELSGLTGAVSRMPYTVVAFAVAGVSLAGLPPTMGFVGKWLLLESSLAGGQWWWAPVLLVGGLLTFGYVAKVVRATFDPPGDTDLPDPQPVPWRMQGAALGLALLSVVLGLTSWPLTQLVARGLPWEVVAS